MERIGCSMALTFSPENLALWDLVQERLTSPVKKTCLVLWKTPGYPRLLAGISVFTRRTMLADDKVAYATDLIPLKAYAWLNLS